MKRQQIAWLSVAGTLAIALGLFIIPPAARQRPALGAGATPEEIRAFADAQGAAARRSRLPPFREVTYLVTPMSATVTTRWYLRRGHPFITRSVVFPFHNEFQQTGPNAFKLMVGPRYFTGNNTIRRTWKWDI